MKILLAHDGSDHAEKALERAAGITKKTNAELTVIAVTPDLCFPSAELSLSECDTMAKAFAKETEGVLKRVVDTLASQGVTAKTVLENGHVVDKILETAESIGADLIVLGSRGRHGATRLFLGSISSKIAEHAKCDVLIVK
jgi:nucleotide-binding universal stress UspA family protein